jgi:hypothetical protein
MSDLEKFQALLRDHREIHLVHQRKRYKAKSVVEVLYCLKEHNPCGFHDRRYQHKYVVKCEDSVCFYLVYYEECSCCDSCIELHSTHIDDLPRVLQEVDPQVCDILFPIQSDSDSY